MLFSTEAILALGLVVAARALPSPDSIHLDNGNEVVAVSTGTSKRGDVASRQAGLSCDGSAFCEQLGLSCDNAYRNIQPGNTYLTGGDAGSTGVCSGTCGIFVSGDHCQFSGTQLQEGYNAIRGNGCEHCGIQTMDNGCQIKIDRVTGC